MFQLGIILIILKSFSLIPFKYKRNDKSTLKPKPSPWTSFWWTTHLIITIVLIITARLYHLKIFHAHSYIGHINDILKFSIAIATVLLALLVRWNHRLHNRMLKIQIFLTRMTVNKLDNNKSLKQFYVKQYCYKFWIYQIVAAYVELRVFFGIENNHQWTKFWMSNLYPSTMCRFLHLCHILYIDLLSEELISLVQNLTNVKNSLVVLSKCPKRDESHQSKVLQNVNKISQLKKHYGLIWSILISINKSFAWVQVFNISNNFIQFSCDFYWSYETWRRDQEGFYGTVDVFFSFIKI